MNHCKHLTLFDVHFKEEPGDEWKTVQVDGRTKEDIPANFLQAYGGVYSPLSECANFKIEMAHETSKDSWCEPEYAGEGVYVHRETH